MVKSNIKKLMEEQGITVRKMVELSRISDVTILRQYPYVLKAELFDSQQRGDNYALSDVDVIVLFAPETRPKDIGIYEVELAP